MEPAAHEYREEGERGGKKRLKRDLAIRDPTDIEIARIKSALLKRKALQSCDESEIVSNIMF